ncbi:MAG: DNA gyrase inhibitor YacG [Rhizobiales bacterium PAR1]|nr:MAG: DNA gyrase inhibitor YacG [Rhizobiales bacterium PAR1]
MSDDLIDDKAPIRAPLCPICRKLVVKDYRPFCSKRCADVDLSRWLGGVYAIPAREEDEGDGRRTDDDLT